MTSNANENDSEIKFLCKSHRISENPAEISSEFLERKRNFWKEKIKKDGIRNVVAPMVDQSELAFRMFCRKYSAHLCYTPMIHAHLFVNDTTYRRNSFTTIDSDRPLIVQFCANDPEVLLNACRLVEDYCDGVDINLGCPQLIAKKGHYGAFLQEYPELIEQMISHVHKYCRIPLSAKIRMLDNIPSTIEYAKRIERAGASMLTIHGRTREQKGDKTGLANWEVIRALKNELAIPVLANGNIQLFDDIDRCIAETGVDGVMSAEGILSNPMLFHDTQNRFNFDVAMEYLDFAQKYNAPFFAIRAHLFRICHYSFLIFDDLRDRNGICCDLSEFRENIQELRKRCLEEMKSKGIEYGQNPWMETLGKCFPGNVELKGISLAKLVHSTPHYFCKPYVRPSSAIGTTINSDEQMTISTQIRQKKREELERLISETGLSKRQIRKREKRQRNKQKEAANRRKQIYPECGRCQKPAGQNCANQMCRKCCKFVCLRGIQLKCKGHCFEHEKLREKQILLQKSNEPGDGAKTDDNL